MIARSALESELLNLLWQGPLTAAELRSAIGCDESVLNRLLDALRAEGLVRVHQLAYRGKGSGSGRARRIYARTDVVSHS